MVNVLPDSLNTPMPHGLVTRISSQPSPSKSPIGPKRLSPVFSSQPPKRVPLAAMTTGVKLPPSLRSSAMPHGLVTSISARPSPSKSPIRSKRLSPLLSSQPPKRVPFAAITGEVSVLPS